MVRTERLSLHSELAEGDIGELDRARRRRAIPIALSVSQLARPSVSDDLHITNRACHSRVLEAVKSDA